MASHPHYLWADLFRQKGSGQGLVAEALGQNVLFSTLSKKEILFLTSLVYERVYEPGEVVFRQSDRGLGMYVIARGSVLIKTAVPNGGDVEITRLEKGSFFGELSLVEEDGIRSATAVALEKTRLIGFFKPELMELLERKPEMGVKLLLQLSRVLGKRLVEINEKLAESAVSGPAELAAKRVGLHEKSA